MSDQSVAENSDNTTLIRDKTSMPPPGFEPIIAASERLQNNDLHREATGIAIS
jgi:hypothetical protein